MAYLMCDRLMGRYRGYLRMVKENSVRVLEYPSVQRYSNHFLSIFEHRA